jgi:WXG100 family type VII secretion target
MTEIRVTPESLEQKGGELISKKGQLEETIRGCNTMIENLRGEWTGNLAKQVFAKWDEIYPSFKTTYENMQAAGDILKKAAAAFRQVDETKLS